MAQQIFNDTKINVEFEQATNRQQLVSGDALPTLFGKISKVMSDFKPIVFSGDYNDLENLPNKHIITGTTGASGNSGKYKRFATIDCSNSTWSSFNGQFHICDTESSRKFVGTLHTRIRTGASLDTISGHLIWTAISQTSYIDCIVAVKVGSGIYDLYIKMPYNNTNLSISILSSSDINKLTLHSGQNFVEETEISENIAMTSSLSVIASDVRTVLNNPKVTANTFYIPFSTIDTTNEIASHYYNDGFKMACIEGTTENTGASVLYIGNDIATGTAGNKMGKLRVFSSGSGRIDLVASDCNNNYDLKLPAVNGTLSVEGHTHNYLPLSGGTLSRDDWNPLVLKRTNSTGTVALAFENNNGKLGYVGMNTKDGALFRVDSTGTTKIFLDESNYKTYVTPANIGAKPVRRCRVGQLGGTATNPWYKFASITRTGMGYDDQSITFKVSQGFNDSSTECGILTAHFRLLGTGTFSTGELVWEYAGMEVNFNDYVLAYKNTSDNSCTVELWTKIDSGYAFRFFEVLSEHSRISFVNPWTLHSFSQAGYADAITEGYTQIVSKIMPKRAETIASDLFAPLTIQRVKSDHGAGIKFENANGILGYIYMGGTANGGLLRATADQQETYTMLDTNNYKTYVTPSNIGALSTTGTAASASKLSNTTAIGSATQPVYFNASGVPVATTYTLGKSVPSNAVFTDTDYRVKIQEIQPAAGMWLYPTFHSATSASQQTLSANEGLRYYSQQGTTSTAGRTIISIGNDVATGTAGNKYGELRIYGASNGHGTISQATTTAALTHTLPATSGTILNTGTTSFTQTLTSGTKIGSIKINGTSTDIYAPTNTDTHWTTGIRVGASGTNSNAAATNPYLKVLDNTTYRSQVRLVGGGGTTVSSDANGNITISSTSTTSSVTSGGTGLPTAGAVYTALSKYLPLTGGTVNGGIIANSFSLPDSYGGGPYTISYDGQGMCFNKADTSDGDYGFYFNDKTIFQSDLYALDDIVAHSNPSGVATGTDDDCSLGRICGVSTTFRTTGLTYPNTGRCTITNGGYYRVGNRIFVQMTVTANTNLGVGDYWTLISGFPTPATSGVAITATVISYRGAYTSFIDSTGTLRITTDDYATITAGKVMAFTGSYITSD